MMTSAEAWREATNLFDAVLTLKTAKETARRERFERVSRESGRDEEPREGGGGGEQPGPHGLDAPSQDGLQNGIPLSNRR